MQQFGPRSVSRTEMQSIRQYCAPILPLVVRRLFEMLHFTFSTAVVTAAPAAEVPAGWAPPAAEEGECCAHAWRMESSAHFFAGKDAVLTKRDTMMATVAAQAVVSSLNLARHCK